MSCRALWLAALLACTVPAYAEAKDDAITSAVADCVTTGAALAGGLSELNPAGPIAACALKPIAVAMVEGMPEPDRTHGLHTISALWGGAAINNVLATIGAGAAAPVFGVLFAIGVWAAGEEEREFARHCALHRSLSAIPLTCTYTRAP